MSLAEIMRRHRSDKARHGYCPHYELYLSDLRGHSVKLLEIGVWKGASLRAWSEWLGPLSKIVGVDLAPRWTPALGGPITVEIGDATDPVCLARVCREGPFDVIVDDGSHRAQDHLATFCGLWNALAWGGWYVVEDVFTMHDRKWSDPGQDNICDLLHKRTPEIIQATDEIAEVHLIGGNGRDGLLCIRKRKEKPMCRDCDKEPEATRVSKDLTTENAAAIAGQWIDTELPKLTYPEGQFAGRGIVIAAGGIKYGVCAWVAVRALRHVGCTLPIEIWYRGGGERQRGLEDLLAPYGVTWVDAFAVRDAGHPHARLNGWELKPFAIQWCRFAEVLFVDADNVAVTDPTYLFDDPNYTEAGTVLWPDYSRMAPSRESWGVFGVPYRSEPAVESGQILIDKRRSWPALCLANWYGERSKFYFRFVYGDKELFHLAWRRLGIPYAMPSRRIHTLRGTMCQHDFAGQRVFQHRNFNKWNLHQNNPRPGFRLEAECFAWIEELKSLWSPAANTFPTAADMAAIAALDGRRYRYSRNGKYSRDLVLRRDGTFAEGGARCERYWTIRNGRLQIAQQDGQLIMDLSPDGANGWSGRWLLHEKMPVRLEPAEQSAETANPPPVSPGKSADQDTVP